MKEKEEKKTTRKQHTDGGGLGGVGRSRTNVRQLPLVHICVVSRCISGLGGVVVHLCVCVRGNKVNFKVAARMWR